MGLEDNDETFFEAFSDEWERGSHRSGSPKISLRNHRTSTTHPPSHTPADPDDLIIHSARELPEVRKLVNDHMTPEERQLKHFTRKNLMKLPNWHQWREADDLQLDTHLKAAAVPLATQQQPKD